MWRTIAGCTVASAVEAFAWVSPQDLANLGVRDGDLVDVHSGEHSLRIPVRAMEGVARRTVVVPHGLPDLNVNELIPAGPQNIERVSGQLRMTGIAARVVAV